MTINSQGFWMSLMLLGASTQALGLGLGEIQLHSYLNEPLTADLALLEFKNMELDEISVHLANPDEFTKANIERAFYLTKIQFTVMTDKNGAPVVRLTSKDALKDPFLTMLLEASWPGGHIVREYTLLLDPPPVASKKPFLSKVTAVAKTESRTSHAAKSTVQSTIGHAQSETSASLRPGSDFGPTTGLDTLWRISSRLTKNTDVSVHQAMLAILKKNPNAFLKGNVNGLMEGRDLKLPTIAEMGFISPSEAEALVKEHAKIWQTGGSPQVLPDFAEQKTGSSKTSEQALKLVTKPIQDPLEAPTVDETPATEKVAQEHTVNETTIVPTTKDIAGDTTLSATKVPSTPVSINGAGGEISKIADRVNLLEEALDTVKRVNQDLLSKQELMQQQNESLTKLLTLRDEEISKLLKNMGNGSQKEGAALGVPSVAENTPTTVAQVSLPQTTSTLPTPTTVITPTTTPVTAQPIPIVSKPAAPPAEDSNTWLWIALLCILGGTLGTVVVLARQKKLNFEGLNEQYDAFKENAVSYFQNIKTKSFNKDEDEPSFFRSTSTSSSTEMKLPPENIKSSTGKPYVINQASAEKEVVTSKQESPEPQFDIDEAIAAFSESYSSSNINKHTSEDQTGDDEERRSKLSDIDIYITYERFEAAEELVKELLKQHPNYWPGQLKALELYIKTNRMKEISDWLAHLPLDFAKRSPQIWDDALNLLKPLNLKKLQPGQALELSAPIAKEAEYGEIEFVEDTVSSPSRSLEVSAKEEDPGKWQATSQFTLEGEALKENLHAIPTKLKESAEDEFDKRQEMVTKLELAKAYLQMEDLDGAKALLQDVIKYGDAEQIAQAENLLKQC